MQKHDYRELLKEYGVPESVQETCSLENIGKGKLTFLADISFKKFIKPDQGLIILTNSKNYEKVKEIAGNTYVVVDNPHHAFIEIHNAIHASFRPFNAGNFKPETGKNCIIDQSARFGKNVKLGDNVQIHANVTVGSNVSIGNNTLIYAGASLYDDIVIGANCILDAGVVIGGEGFSTVYNDKKGAMRLTNIGGVRIGNYVEIGSNSTIDRASFMNTIVGDRVRIDNLVQIGHNTRIGNDARIAASSCLGGSCVVGNGVWIGIGCLIKDHVTLGDGSQVLMGSVVVSDIEKNARVQGFYAMPNESWLGHMKDLMKKYKLK